MTGWSLFDTPPDEGQWVDVYGEREGDDGGFWITAFEWTGTHLNERGISFDISCDASKNIEPLLWRPRPPLPIQSMVARAKAGVKPKMVTLVYTETAGD